MTVLPDLGAVRQKPGVAACSAMVAGPDGPAEAGARIHEDAWAALVRLKTARSGGYTRMPRCSSAACGHCCCKSLHPLAMAGVARSTPTYRGESVGPAAKGPVRSLRWTTFGPAADAQRAVDRVRGNTPAGPRGRRRTAGPYEASDPHLLEWVHIAEVDSFLLAHQLYGAAPPRSERPGRVRGRYRPVIANGTRRNPTRRRPRKNCGCGSRHSGRSWLALPRRVRPLASCLLTPPLPLAARGPVRPCWPPRRCRCCPHGRECRCCCPISLRWEATVIRMAGPAQSSVASDGR